MKRDLSELGLLCTQNHSGEQREIFGGEREG